MHWVDLLLFLSAGYATGVTFYLLSKTDRLKFMAFFWASVTLFALMLSNLLDVVTTGKIAEFIATQAAEWGHVYTITLVLGGLILFIRESKPEFSQFPRVYAALPTILIISYLLVYNISVLKWWVLTIAQVGAVIVALIMYGMYSYYKKIYRTIFAGAVLFLVTYILELSLPVSLNFIWQILLVFSIVTFVYGFLVVDRHFEKARDLG